MSEVPLSHPALTRRMLHLFSGTRNPKPKTRNPKFETRNPKPETQNPKIGTRNSKPETRNPKPETRNSNPKPFTLSQAHERLVSTLPPMHPHNNPRSHSSLALYTVHAASKLKVPVCLFCNKKAVYNK